MSTTASVQRTIAEQQIFFRELNEQILTTAESRPFAGAIPFICECSGPDCMDLVSLTFDEYESIRLNSRRFFNLPGHEADSVAAGAEIVLGVIGQFTIVEKIGLAGELAATAQEEAAG